jgi:hypothetical protein
VKQSIYKSWYLTAAAFALVLLVTRPLAAQNVTFNLTNVGSGDPSLDNIYTSPYTGNINGGATIPVICDDFADESFIPEEWTALASSLSPTSTSVNGNLKWGTSNVVDGTAPTIGSVNEFSWDLTQTQAYDVAAILSIDILNSTQGSMAQQDLSYALWGLFDPTGTAGDLGAFAWLNSYADYSDQSAAESDLSSALGQVNSAITNNTLGSILGNYNVTIYSYVSPSNGGMTPLCGGSACSQLPPQEFISVTTPEASTPVLMAMDLLGFMALVVFFRKRIGRSV